MSERYWINLSDWMKMTLDERGILCDEVEAQGFIVALDICDSIPKRPKNTRISDFEEYEGEATSMGMDSRGFNV